MVEVMECETAEQVRELNRTIKKKFSIGYGLIKEKPKAMDFSLPYLPQIPFAQLVAAAYPRVYPPQNMNAFGVVRQVQRAVCESFGIKLEDLLSPRRVGDLIIPRHTAAALSQRLTSMSLPEIGRMFNRDHTTILHACRKMRPIIEAIKLPENAGVNAWVDEAFKLAAGLSTRRASDVAP